MEIHLTTPLEALARARLGIPLAEWDVKTVQGDQLLGVIEVCDDGHMFTDTFGHMTEFMNGEELLEVYNKVVDLFTNATRN